MNIETRTVNPTYCHSHRESVEAQLNKYQIAVTTLDQSVFSADIHMHAQPEEFACADDIFYVALFVKGEVTMQIGFDRFTFRPNDMVIGRVGTPKRIEHIRSNAVVRLVAFKTSFPARLDFPEYLMDHARYYVSSSLKPRWTLSADEMKHLNNLVSNLEFYLDRQEARIFGDKLLANMFNVFVYELGALASAYGEELPQKSLRKKQLFLHFYRLVKREFHQHREISYYADRLSVSPKYLSEIVKETSGITATRTVEQFVIEEAKALLNKPTLSVSQVADKLNFPEQSSFGKYFKRTVGVSPKTFRRTL